MAAPDYVPTRTGSSKYYESPPRRPAPWLADRPGEMPTGIPEGGGMGWQGPDQGYAYKLVNHFRDQVHLAEGEHWEDVAEACVLVALKRASLYGRAPVKYDLEVAFRIWGLLDPQPDPELVELRRGAFAGVHSPHHYLEARRITDAVPDDALRKSPELVARDHEQDWRAQLDAAVLAPPASHDDEYDD